MERHNNFTEAQRCNLPGQDSSCPPWPDRLWPSTGRGPPAGPLSIALYRTRPSRRSSPLPSTGRGPLQGPLRCPLLDQALCTFSWNKKTSPSQDEALPAQQQQSIDFRRT